VFDVTLSASSSNGSRSRLGQTAPSIHGERPRIWSGPISRKENRHVTLCPTTVCNGHLPLNCYTATPLSAPSPRTFGDRCGASRVPSPSSSRALERPRSDACIRQIGDVLCRPASQPSDLQIGNGLRCPESVAPERLQVDLRAEKSGRQPLGNAPLPDGDGIQARECDQITEPISGVASQ
jgi:hypothetical protein